ncbi:MAG: cupin domain-containing protein [Desulfobacteraceae bacterium]|nr:MAG: cupin domain-containing protein [Desulfobacteraceae bacterium]
MEKEQMGKDHKGKDHKGKDWIVKLEDAVTGELHGGAGTFRVLIDEPRSGARHFSLLVNTSRAGAKGSAHTHEVEHCWYILSGTGTMYMDGKAARIGPKTAIYTPPGVLHKIDVDEGEDLTYVVIYAPPGPEQQLKAKGVHAFDPKK